MRHPDGRSVAAPVHAGRDREKGTLRNVLATIAMTSEGLRGWCETTPLRDQGPRDVPQDGRLGGKERIEMVNASSCISSGSMWM
jgi:hypothetical protein